MRIGYYGKFKPKQERFCRVKGVIYISEVLLLFTSLLHELWRRESGNCITQLINAPKMSLLMKTRRMGVGRGGLLHPGGQICGQ